MTENCVTMSSGLSSGAYACASYNSDKNGYICGGSDSTTGTGTARSNIDKLNFSNETVTNIGNILATRNTAGAGVQSTTLGYLMGGYNCTGSGNTAVSTIQKLAFANDTNVTIASNIGVARYYLASGGISSSSAGYACGGTGQGGTNYSSRVDKLIFSTETCSSLTSTITLGCTTGAAFNTL
jgi:hypothetical protein